VCDALPQEKKNELLIINRIGHAGEKYPKSRQDWELLEKYAKSNKYPEAKELALFFLGMSGRQILTKTNKSEKAGIQEMVLLQELDEEIKLDIAAEIYERIINYMYQKEELPDKGQKLRTLNQIRNVLFIEYRDILTDNDELGMLYDRTLLEVIEDIENDEF
jgi:hypothetical protein